MKTTPIINSLNLNVIANKNCPMHKNIVKIGKDLLGEDLTLAKGVCIDHTRGVSMENIDSSIGLILCSPKDKFAAQMIPKDLNIIQIKEYLENIILNMKQKAKCGDKDMFAFITGGLSHDVRKPVTTKSLELEDTLVNVLEQNNVETSSVTEKYASGAENSFKLYAHKDNISFFGNIFEKLKNCTTEIPEEAVKILDTIFNNVELQSRVKPRILKEGIHIMNSSESAKIARANNVARKTAQSDLLK